MRKEWVKRDQIYYKPFYKQKSKMCLLGIFALGIVFFIYQAVSINQLPNTSTPWSLEGTMKDLRKKHKNFVKSLGKKQSEVYGSYEKQKSEAEDNGTAGSAVAAGQGIQIIRGIRLFDYDAYKPNYEHKFRCLDGTLEIPYDRVNDDYCDCLGDGSDEPSTNACSSGKFYCKYQRRHITGRGQDVWVASSRVNDGICDCCDGSDEWLTAQCPNVCV